MDEKHPYADRPECGSRRSCRKPATQTRAHWDGGSAAVAMSEVDAPVIVGSIGEDGMMSIDLSALQGTRGVPLPPCSVAAVWGRTR
jgi:hypothetical protein